LWKHTGSRSRRPARKPSSAPSSFAIRSRFRRSGLLWRSGMEPWAPGPGYRRAPSSNRLRRTSPSRCAGRYLCSASDVSERGARGSAAVPAPAPRTVKGNSCPTAEKQYFNEGGHRLTVAEREEPTETGLGSTARCCGRRRHRQANSVRVCSPTSRRVASLRPRSAGLTALTPAPRTLVQTGSCRRCSLIHPLHVVVDVLSRMTLFRATVDN
jgi:hypothetical protein